MQRCAANNSRAALAVGIHVSNQVSIAWAMSAALAGLAGTLIATLTGLSPGLSDVGTLAFPVIVVGGLSSLGGAFVAGLLLGVLQAFTDGMLTPALEFYLRTHTSDQLGRRAATGGALRDLGADAAATSAGSVRPAWDRAGVRR